jgi:CopG family nickel-responsive transcriptional regulator
MPANALQATEQNNGGVSRISVSLPEGLLRQLDALVAERGFDSRSQAIAEMISHGIADHQAERGSEVMAGTITLVYDHTTPHLQKRLADLQHAHVDAVISSLHVHLMHSRTMEVILVQGPAERLHGIADRMITNRGVVCGRLQLTTALIPPLHQPTPGEQRP